VFRYALEHWAPDSYRIQVFHDAPLTEEQSAQVQALQKHCESANAVVQTVALSGDLDENTRLFWESLKAPQLPHVTLQLPVSSGSTSLVWSGSLAELQVSSLFTSPVRTQIVRSLEGGESAVWVFLESGDEARDNEIFSQVEAEVARLQQTLKLAPIEAADLAELSGSPTELTIRFSCVRVSRTDPVEQVFRDILLSVEPDLRDPELISEPMLFPVFGRGRALYALIGEGISSQMVEEGARFLIGGCQCTVKVQNPGTDLLLTAAWETYVAPEVPEPPQYVAIPGTSSPAPVMQEAASTGSEATVTVSASEAPVAPQEDSTAASGASEPGHSAEPAVTASSPQKSGASPLAVALLAGGLVLLVMAWARRS
jgi:hypothetical protein